MNKQMWLEKRAYDEGDNFTAENTVQMQIEDAMPEPQEAEQEDDLPWNDASEE